ncbi:MAG: hypothetical protein ACP5QK_09440 [Myxococcota bacterium]
MKHYLLIFIAFVITGCFSQADLSLWDIHTNWEKDSSADITTSDTSENQKYYEYSCTEITENVVMAEGMIYYDGQILDTARLSVAITTKPPPGMPSCYFTIKPKKFPFGFRFTNLEKDTEVYIMAVLKMDGAAIPIPKEGVDYYGDYGKTPIKLTQDIKDIEIHLKLYQKE